MRICHDAVADRDLPRIGTQVPSDDVEQRRLATARGPEDGEELAARNGELDTVKRGDSAKLARDSMKTQCDRLGHGWKGTLTPAEARGLGHASPMSAWQNDGNEITGKVLAVAGVFAILALVMGFAIGMFLGRSTAPDLATLAGQAHQSAATLSADLAPAKAAYAAAVPAGKIEDPALYADAQAAITKVNNRLIALDASFDALSPGGYGKALAALAALATAASTPVTPAEFDAAFARAQQALAVLAGT